MKEEARRLCENQQRAILKILVARGAAGHGYRATTPGGTERILSLRPWPEYPSAWINDGVKVWVCKTRLGANPALAGIKHLNRLEQVLASAEWPNDSYAEGLMLDSLGHVIEGTRTNLFARLDGRIITPTLSQCGVAGVMQEVICETLENLDTSVTHGPLTMADLLRAESAWLSNSIVGVWPIRTITLEDNIDKHFSAQAFPTTLITQLQHYDHI